MPAAAPFAAVPHVQPASAEWLCREDEFSLPRVPHWETLFTLANGYAGVRGSLELSPLLGAPGLYVAGAYDKTGLHTDEIVNLPCSLELDINIDGFGVDLRQGRVLQYARALDLRQGILFTELVYEDIIRRRLHYASGRLMHKTEPHLCLLWGTLTLLDSGEGVTLTGGVDAWATRHGSSSKRNHLATVATRDLGTGVLLSSRFKHYDIEVAQAAVLRVRRRGVRRVDGDDDRIREVWRGRLAVGEKLHFEKRMVTCTSREGRDAPGRAAAALARLRRRGVAALVRSHVRAWDRVWDRSDVVVEGDAAVQQNLRFSLFHLASLARPEDDHVSIGAKGLHGNGYNGQIFWDTEVYLVPFFIHTDPAAARALLAYRYHFLSDARKNARELGCAGVRYPWNSSSQTARERARRGWQEHLNADIAWAVDRYVEATGDGAFFREMGARLILETAAYWPDRLTYEAETGRYVMQGLTGPDEIHGGIDNNPTTSYLARWHLRRAVRAMAELKAAGCWGRVRREARVTEKEVTGWSAIADRIYINYNQRRGFHEQFDGYFKLKERRIDRAMTKMEYTGPVQHSFKPTKVAQQADILMMYHMFGPDFPAEVKARGYEYYEPRCSHTSTLSRCIFAAVAARAGLVEEALRLFKLSLETDTGPAAECGSGIHAACLGGNWQAAVLGFAGFALSGGTPTFAPRLPKGWKRLAFSLQVQGQTLSVSVTGGSIHLKTDRGSLPAAVNGKALTVTRRGQRVRL